MNKNVWIGLLVVIIAVLAFFAFKPKEDVVTVSPTMVTPSGQTITTNNPNGKDYQPQNTATQTPPIAQSIKGWKTYASAEYGFSFQYPSTWLMTESNAIDRTGKVLGHTIDLKNDTTGAILHVTYNTLGAEVYSSFLPEYKKTMTEIQVSGEVAYKSNVLKSKDIKGNVYNPAERDLFVTFLDKSRNGSFTVSMQTPSNNTEASMIQIFDLLLQTFVK